MSLRSRTATLPGKLALSPVCTSARPILKRAGRPSPLPLSPSPFPFSAGFSAMLSVSARSPHVHFPPSPLLQSVISIQSPLSSSSFTRGSVPPTSPNNTVQVEAQEAVVPPSFSYAAFRLADAPKPAHKKGKKVEEENPAAVHFEDPRSPRPTSVMSLGAAALKLASKPRTELYNALTTYPRSPYPSAPAQEDASEEAGSSFQTNDVNADQRGPPKRRNSESAVPVPPPRARSLGARNTNHHSVTSKLTPTTSLSQSRARSRSLSRCPPPQLNLFSPSGAGIIMQPASLSPVQESSTDDDGVGHRPSNNKTSPASALNNAFWESVSIDLEGLPLSGSDGSFPESVSSWASLDTGKAVINQPIHTPQYPRMMRMSQMSPMPLMQPELLFADGNGNLYSPALPRKEQPHVSQGLDVASGVSRNTLTAPSPKDPRSKFPSFSTAFGVVQMIRTPVRAHLH